MHVGEWVKSHPWTTGFLVVGGGLTFILFSGWFSGGGSGSSAGTSSTGPSPAELAAQAQVAGAQIAGNVATTQSNNAYKAAQLAADVKENEDNLAAALGSKSLDVQSMLGQGQLANEAALQKQNYFATINQQQETRYITEVQARLADDAVARQQHLEEVQARLADDTANRTLIANSNIVTQLIDRIPVAAVGP